MNDFKFFKENNFYNFMIVDGHHNNNILTIQPINYEYAEYCFQFNNHEPITLGHGYLPLTFSINPNSNGNITFFDNNNDLSFRIFARERT